MGKNLRNILLGILLGVIAFACVALVAAKLYMANVSDKVDKSDNTKTETQSDKVEKETKTEKTKKSLDLNTVERKMLTIDYDKSALSYTPSVAPYSVDADLGNVYDHERLYLNEEAVEKLVANNFVVVEGSSAEFFDIYEFNRYAQYGSFVTTDSMMHTYHLYFAMLQENTEKKFLADSIKKMSVGMFNASVVQYETLKGSEWEEAARLNVIYFGVANRLLGTDGVVLPQEASEEVVDEVCNINAADGIYISSITGDYEDYSQYKPRGYYEGDAQLESYFRTMMWYGRTNYAQNSELMNRCALLMTLAMNDENNKESLNEWEAVYEVTSFFVGQSDDLLYYDYLPVIDAAYDSDISYDNIKGNDKAFKDYTEGIKQLRSPEINSVVFEDDDGATDKTERAKGFRFMGQRFTLDAAVFTQLCYSQVKEASDGSKRMLPDGLDVPAAMGSDLALDLLKDMGNDKYPNYLENMDKVREKVKDSHDYWTSSLYSGWLYTLNPLLTVKGDGYPSFMTNKEWQKKSLESYLGSYTELKHDTVLYAKQMMAEMGGGDDTVYDDRGYVEPEPVLYDRLYTLSRTTSEGLENLGVISSEDKEGLYRLAELSKSLRDISVKELQNEKLTDDEYELIRGYGGTLEHFWLETIKSKYGKDYASAEEYPMALITDVATDPNGSCLQLGIGGASTIYVIYPIDGELHVGRGGVFNYYQFEQPISDRLTDSKWREMIGMQLDSNDMYVRDNSIVEPDWTSSYRYRWKYDN